MSNEKINRALHSAIGRGCWHRITHTFCSEPFRSYWKCRYCPERWPDSPGEGYRPKPTVPDYCASLDAVAEAETFVLAKVAGKEAYIEALMAFVPASGDTYKDLAKLATAPALDRAKACLKALEKSYE